MTENRYELVIGKKLLNPYSCLIVRTWNIFVLIINRDSVSVSSSLDMSRIQINLLKLCRDVISFL
ncbi:hypothetical protein NDI49_26165 [Trichocoleus sp. ST-U3]